MPGITTSISTRSGFSECTSSFASWDSVVLKTSYPREDNNSRSSNRVSSLSSITRIRGERNLSRVYSSRVLSEIGPIAMLRMGWQQDGCIEQLWYLLRVAFPTDRSLGCPHAQPPSSHSCRAFGCRRHGKSKPCGGLGRLELSHAGLRPAT